jgi:hypothetical protein
MHVIFRNLLNGCSTLHRKYAVKFADELADLIEHEFCVVVVDEEDEELAAMAFMRSVRQTDSTAECVTTNSEGRNKASVKQDIVPCKGVIAVGMGR